MPTNAAALVQLDEAMIMDPAAAAQIHVMQCMAYAEEEQRQRRQREARASAAERSERDLRRERALKGWAKRKAREEAENAA